MSSFPECRHIDDTFGPHASKCRGGFDFTLLFEESVLAILPLAVFFACTSFRILYLRKKERKVVRSKFDTLKLLSYACFAVIQVVLLVLWSLPSAANTRLSVAASALYLFAALPLVFLSYFEHKKTLRSSTILNVYLFVSAILDAARVRTLWLRHGNRSIAAVSTVSLVVKILIFSLESVSKRQILKPELSSCPPESTAGFINRTLFWWLNPLFLKGYKNLLFLHDLFGLDKQLTTSYLSQSFEASWAKVPAESPNRLFITLLSAYKAPVIYGILPRIALIALNFSQPFLITHAVNLSMQDVSNESTNAGYGMIGAYALVYIGIALATGQYQHQTYRAITMIRGGLVSKIFQKTTELSVSAVEAEASVTLMNTDIERISVGLQMVHDLWANLIEIGLATYLLHRQLGAPSGIPLGVAIASIFISAGISGFIMARQKLWLEAIEKRIAVTTKMLGAMREVKLTGLSDTLLTRVHGLRTAELQISKGFRKLLIWALALTYITPVFAPILTFATFAVLSRSKGGDGVDTAQVFTALSLFVLLSTPLGTFIMSLTNFLSAVGCFSRIQTYLNTTPRVDTRIRPSHLVSGKDASATSSELAESLETEKVSLEKFGVRQKVAAEGEELAEDVVVVIQNGAFGWKTAPVPEPTKSEEDAEVAGSKKTKKKKIKKAPESEAEPKPEPELILQNINFSVQREKITAIIGPVGSGKSTLLKALLGEVPISYGTVRIASDDFAFCEQTPWLTNGTVQHSILGTSLFDQEWYDVVVQACALEEDLKQLPRGDQTLVGSKGITLSGGQAQRISLARAVYSQRKILLLDDVLRGLDAHTEDQVFHNLLGEQGLLRKSGATVVLVTSTSMRISYADHIVVLDKTGQIAEQGSFQQLDSTAGSYVAGLSVSTAIWDTVLDDEFLEPSAAGASYKYRPLGQDLFGDSSAAEASRRTGDVEIYAYYFKSIGRLPTVLFAIMLSLFVFAFSFPNVWLKWWATANNEQPNQRLGYYLGIYTLFGATAIIFLMASCWLVIITMVPKSGEFFHLILLKRIMVAPMSFFATTDTGITLNRLSQDLQLIDMDLPVSALNTSAAFMFCIAQLILIAVASKFAAIAFPFCLVAFYTIQRYYLRTSRQLRFMDIEAKAPLFSQFVECLSGLATIRAFGWQTTLEEKNGELLNISQKPFYLLWAAQRWLTVVLDLVIAAIAVLLMILVVKLHGSISAGYVGVALVNVLLFSQSIKLLITYWTMLETHIGAIARIKNFEASTPTENKAGEINYLPEVWPTRGGILFHDVSASYRKSEPILKNVSLEIEPGQKVAICGRTGSGKSSMILSLFRMMEEFSGQIVIDGIDISTIPRQEIRSRIICISQESFLFNATVRINADPTEATADAAIIEALQKVHLWDVIEKKGGLDAELNDTFLSHGQKQLFCLARAMFRKSKILVLDEATSSVDKVTDELMESVIDAEFRKYTILSIGHKLVNVIKYDKVAVLAAGKLLEFESPGVLLADPQSNFSHLYRRFGKGKVEHESGENTAESGDVVIAKEEGERGPK